MNTKKTLGLAGNYMDVEETIYALEKLEKRELNYESQSIHRAIDLLKRGEKFEKMWEEFCVNEGDLVKVVNLIKRRYEQKYFPKKKVIK